MIMPAEFIRANRDKLKEIDDLRDENITLRALIQDKIKNMKTITSQQQYAQVNFIQSEL